MHLILFLSAQNDVTVPQSAHSCELRKSVHTFVLSYSSRFWFFRHFISKDHTNGYENGTIGHFNMKFSFMLQKSMLQ